MAKWYSREKVEEKLHHLLQQKVMGMKSLPKWGGMI
jgi:hypothetical protein